MIDGRVTMTIQGSFAVLTPGDMFFVPCGKLIRLPPSYSKRVSNIPGNAYFIANRHNHPARLFFAQARKVEIKDGP